MESILKTILLLISALFLPSGQSNSDFTTLVYNNCTSSQNNGSSRSYAATLSSLFEQLQTHSSNSNFYKTTLADDQVGGISGFFQCRGDLSRDNCNKCIRKIPEFSNTLCNEAAVSARIQLSGCYAHYDTDESLLNIASKYDDMLYKICGKAGKEFDGFEEMRDAGFAALESGVVEATHGYYKTYYESMELVAQCQEDLEPCDCGECVSIAGKIAQDECGLSIYGQVYLKKCFISYHYYPEGIPKYSKEEQGGNGRGKTMAIVVGVAAALLLGLIFMMFLKSCGKKDDDY